MESGLSEDGTDVYWVSELWEERDGNVTTDPCHPSRERDDVSARLGGELYEANGVSFFAILTCESRYLIHPFKKTWLRYMSRPLAALLRDLKLINFPTRYLINRG